MPFVDLIDEQNKKISVNTDYVIMIGETMCGNGYIVDSTKTTTYTNQKYQDVLNAIKSALAPTKKK
ncbi:MAG: hypothetical protein J6R52_03895 [Alphaproteobacteria bacterium]|nr:hypothetical protein [Alphaproteobacteria bacterium]